MISFKKSNLTKIILTSLFLWLIAYMLTCYNITEYINKDLVNGEIHFMEVFTNTLFYRENYPIFILNFLPFIIPTIFLQIVILFFYFKKN